MVIPSVIPYISNYIHISYIWSYMYITISYMSDLLWYFILSSALFVLSLDFSSGKCWVRHQCHGLSWPVMACHGSQVTRHRQDLAPVWWTRPLFWRRKGDSSWRPPCFAMLSLASTWVPSCRMGRGSCLRVSWIPQVPSWTTLDHPQNSVNWGRIHQQPSNLWQRDQQNQQHTVTKPSLRIRSFDVLWQSMTIYDILRISCDGSVFGFVLEELCKDLNSMDFEGSPKVGRRWTCFSYFQLLSPLDPSTFLFLWMHRNAMPNANAMLQSRNDLFTYSKWDVEQDCQIISNYIIYIIYTYQFVNISKCKNCFYSFLGEISEIRAAEIAVTFSTRASPWLHSPLERCVKCCSPDRQLGQAMTSQEPWIAMASHGAMVILWADFSFLEMGLTKLLILDSRCF